MIQTDSYELIAPCTGCGHPVAAPLGLLDRNIFTLSRCPGCHKVNPHPQEAEQWRHTGKTLAWGCAFLTAAIGALTYVPNSLITPYI